MKKQTATVQKTPKRVMRTLVSVLKKLDAAQGLLAGDEDQYLPSPAVDKADTLVWEVRRQLKNLVCQPMLITKSDGRPAPG
jgi:hypothetical protein